MAKRVCNLARSGLLLEKRREKKKDKRRVREEECISGGAKGLPVPRPPRRKQGQTVQISITAGFAVFVLQFNYWPFAGPCFFSISLPVLAYLQPSHPSLYYIQYNVYMSIHIAICASCHLAPSPPPTSCVHLPIRIRIRTRYPRAVPCRPPCSVCRAPDEGSAHRVHRVPKAIASCPPLPFLSLSAAVQLCTAAHFFSRLAPSSHSPRHALPPAASDTQSPPSTPSVLACRTVPSTPVPAALPVLEYIINK